MRLIYTTLTVALGLSFFGVSSYLLYFLTKKQDKDCDDDYLLRKKYEKTTKIIVPKQSISLLIGRQGRNIRRIEDETGARIRLTTQNDHDDHAVCLVQGAQDACELAESLINDFLANRPTLVTKDLWVPLACIAHVIGRGGERIREICGCSGAKITVDRENTVANHRKRLMLKGTPEQIVIAESLINEIVGQYEHTKDEYDNILARREPRAPTKTPYIRPKVENFANQSKQHFEVYVSAMVDPSRFWLQIVGPKATELDLLVECMTDYYRKEENRILHALDDVDKGDLVAAVFQYDNKWYRAEVLAVMDDQAELYYVDYGDTDVVARNELYELRTDFLRLHFQAIECYLARVGNTITANLIICVFLTIFCPTDPVGGNWSEQAIDLFEELSRVAQWKKLLAKINGYCAREKTRAKREGSPVPGVDLFDVNDEKDVDIAQELVDRGLAVFKNEHQTNLCS